MKQAREPHEWHDGRDLMQDQKGDGVRHGRGAQARCVWLKTGREAVEDSCEMGLGVWRRGGSGVESGLAELLEKPLRAHYISWRGCGWLGVVEVR